MANYSGNSTSNRFKVKNLKEKDLRGYLRT